jgi:hypothetical protein
MYPVLDICSGEMCPCLVLFKEKYVPHASQDTAFMHGIGYPTLDTACDRRRFDVSEAYCIRRVRRCGLADWVALD